MKKTKNVKVLQWLDTGIFPATVIFSCGFNYKELITILKKNASDWLGGINLPDTKELINSGNYMALRRDMENTKTGEKKTMFYIIIREQFMYTDHEYCKLAHEIVHICQFMLRDFLDRNKEIEAEAYLHTHLMRQCLKALRGT